MNRLDDPLGDDVAFHDAPENIDEDDLHVGVRQNDLERFGDLIDRGAAAHVQEIRRLAAVELDDVHGGHGQTRAVHHATDVAVQTDVREAHFAGAAFRGGQIRQIGLVEEIGVAEGGVVVDGDFRVHGQEGGPFFPLPHAQGVHFHQARVGSDEQFGQVPEKGHGGAQQISRQPGGESGLPGLEGFQTPQGVDVEPQNLFGGRGGQFLDVHPALGRQNHHGFARFPVEGDGDVEFALHLDRGFRQYFSNHEALGAGLVGHQGLPQQALGEGGRVLGGFNELDAPRLAPAAGVNLGLENPGTFARFFKGGGRFPGFPDHRARENGKAEPAH